MSEVALERVPGAPLLEAQRAPPADYYAGNLRRMLEHVLDYHSDLLDEEVRAFARSLLACSVDAQRLFARLIARKGPWLRVDKLTYAELEDLERALEELEALGVL